MFTVLYVIQSSAIFSFFFLCHLAIPTHPRNVIALFVNQSSAAINWQPPAITGDQAFYERTVLMKSVTVMTVQASYLRTQVTEIQLRCQAEHFPHLLIILSRS